MILLSWREVKKMERVNSVLLLWTLFLFIVLPGCAPVISKNLRAQAEGALTFQHVFQNPEAYKGKIVIWGGEIVEAINQKEGTTLIVVLQRPLNRREEPQISKRSEGRFLVLAEGYLDPYIFREGRVMTVAGEILGKKMRPLGEMEYPYPLLQSKEIYLWSGYRYSYYPPPYYSYPWWWSYPYR
jgi:outer membrane lipoprotein